MNYGEISPKQASHTINKLVERGRPSIALRRFFPTPKPLTRKEKIILRLKRIGRRIKLAWLVLRTGECDCDP